ncbi:hypothetical protein EJ06DRAFT_532740 [Trichodelitschia bisporula]|uniref:Uncharacterized protein n=1 Tax=Trichodelitschia bisporula TaxID=703511 RepID=A0A6G1HPH0_9PEZI|nr:hypothetical protein EJ06DRAFT_532740 [Trichodelitschia bisporula]
MMLLLSTLLFSSLSLAQGGFGSTVTATTTSTATVLSTFTTTVLSSDPASAGLVSAGTGSASRLRNSTAFTTQTTVSLFNACIGPASACNPTPPVTYFGSVVRADKTQTVYAVDCVAQGNTTACVSDKVIVTQGPDVFARADTTTSGTTVSISCTIDAANSGAVCLEARNVKPTATATGTAATVTASIGMQNSNRNATREVSTMTFHEADIHYNKLVITAGKEKLTASATNTPPAPPKASATPGTPGTPPKKSGAAPLTHVSAAMSLIGSGLLFALFAL